MDKETYSNSIILKTALIEITSKCNFYCVHCYQNHERDNNLEILDYQKILQELCDLGCFKLTISGGEPFTRKSLLYDLLVNCKKRGFYTSLITNLSLCEKKDIDFLKEIGLDKLRVSLYGNTEKSYNDTCKANCQVEEIKERILYAKNMNLRIDVQTIFIKENINDIQAIYEWCKKCYLDFSFNFVVMGQEGNENINQTHALTKDCLPQLLDYQKDDYLKYYKQMIGRGKREQDFFCVAGKHKLCIASDGAIFPCATWRVSIGNVRDGIVNIWKNPNGLLQKIRAYKFGEFSCFKCEYKDICAFCPGANFLENADEKKPSNQICSFTKIFHEFAESNINE